MLYSRRLTEHCKLAIKKKNHYVNKKKKAGVAMLISDKIDFKIKML